VTKKGKKERLSSSALDKLAAHVAQYSELDYVQLRGMVDHIPVQSCHKGRILIEQGEIPKQCYFILEGCARKFSIDEEGKEVTSDFFTENQTIAILSGTETSGSPFTVTCLEDSVMIVGDLEEQDSEIAKYPEFQDIVLKMVEAGMGELQDTFTAFIGMSPEDRVKYMMGKRPELFFRVPQHQLASYLGITPESLSRIKRRLGHSYLKVVD